MATSQTYLHITRAPQAGSQLLDACCALLLQLLQSFFFSFFFFFVFSL